MFSERRWNTNELKPLIWLLVLGLSNDCQVVGTCNRPTCTSVADCILDNPVDWSQRYVVHHVLCCCESGFSSWLAARHSTFYVLAGQISVFNSKSHCCKTDVHDVRTMSLLSKNICSVIPQFNNFCTAKIWIYSATFTEISVHIQPFS